MTTTRASFALVAASALLLLAGCSGSGPTTTAVESTPSAAPSSAASSPAPAADEAGQPKADACQIIIASFNDVAATSEAIDTNDPDGTLAAFGALTEKVQADFSQITNTEIAPGAQKASEQLTEYSTFLQRLMGDPSQASELMTQVTALQQSFTEAATPCQG